MIARHFVTGSDSRFPLDREVMWSDDGNSSKAAIALVAARARLAASNQQYQKRHAPTNEIYYPPDRRGSDEECIRDLECIDGLDAIVTRNHYGSLVLNTYRTLFIDVDLPDEHQWQGTFNDLRTVLASERSVGFRVYRTAAGFRVLATTTEFDPESDTALGLMKSVGADDAFVRLCAAQRTFRARLTPKPWRCGSTHPPNKFPRTSTDEQRSFDEWLTQYEYACRGRATCQFLDRVGPRDMHDRLAPIVDYHDRVTKAFQDLELA